MKQKNHCPLHPVPELVARLSGILPSLRQPIQKGCSNCSRQGVQTSFCLSANLDNLVKTLESEIRRTQKKAWQGGQACLYLPAPSFQIQRQQAIPAGFPFFFLRAQRKEPKKRAAKAAEKTPSVKVRNRRGKNSLRSNSLPLHPVPDLVARLSGNGLH